MSMKVYEVMEQYKDYRFCVATSDNSFVHMGYKAVCKSYIQNMQVEEIEVYPNRTVLIIVY